MALQVASLFGVLRMDDREFKNSVRDAKSGMSDLSGRLKDMGSRAQQLGAKMTVATAPLALGFTAAVRGAMNFDEAMTNTASLLGSSREETAALGKELLAIGRNTRAGPQAVADSFYDIVSGVQDASTHMAILNAAIATSEAGNSDLAGTTAGLISVMNAYSFSADRASWVSDVLTRTVGMGVGTMDEFVAALGPASGLAYDVGIGFDELAASAAFLTSTGGTASESVTQLTAIMTAFLKPNQAMTEALQAMGYESGTAALQALGLSGSVQALSEAVGGSTDQMAQALGSTEALGGAVGLLSERAGAFTSSFQEGLDGVTERARNIQMESAAAQFDLLTSRISTMAISIGMVLLPILVDLVEQMQPVIDQVIAWMEQNPELTQTLVLLGVALIALGPLIGVVGTAMSVVGTASGLAKTGISALSAVARSAAGPWLAMAAAIGAVIAALQQFHSTVGSAAQYAGQQLAPAVAGGLTRKHIEDEVFRQMQAQFGDLGARLAFGSSTLNIQGYIDQIYAGGRAGGGNVQAGMGYMVGEQGPEFFVPSSSGSIMDAHDTAGMMGGVTFNGPIHIQASTYEGGRAAARGFGDEMRELLNANG